MKTTYIPAAFYPVEGKVDLSNIANFAINQLYAIQDVTARAPLYDPATPGLGYVSVLDSIVTLQYDTSALHSSDVLMVIYDPNTYGVGSGSGGSGSGPLSIGDFNTSFLAWVASLPTTLPSTSGVAWNNGGVICISQ